MNSISKALENSRAMLLELYNRRGWEALGYSSWRVCVVAEFGQKQSTVYQQLAAAQVELNISANAEIGKIPEGTLRPLGSLEPEEQREVWNRAVADTGGKRPTARDVERAKDATAPERSRREILLAKSGDEQLEAIKESEAKIHERAAKRRADEAKAERRRQVERCHTMSRNLLRVLRSLGEEYAEAAEMQLAVSNELNRMG